jgi:hypothetical protein
MNYKTLKPKDVRGEGYELRRKRGFPEWIPGRLVDVILTDIECRDVEYRVPIKETFNDPIEQAQEEYVESDSLYNIPFIFTY